MKRHKGLVVFASVVVGLLLIDILSKFFTDGVSNVTIIPKVVSFDSHYNTGIAWGWLSNRGVWLIVMISLLTVGAVAAWWFLGRKKVFGNVAFAFFIAGAVGNLYDRIAHGHVRDFIVLDFWPNFAIFNFADICLSIGTVLLIIYFIFFTRHCEEQRDKAIPRTERGTHET